MHFLRMRRGRKNFSLFQHNCYQLYIASFHCKMESMTINVRK